MTVWVEVPPAVLTDTSTVPAFAAGVFAVQLVEDEHETLVACAVPNKICVLLVPPVVVEVSKFVPVIVTVVPPPVGPLAGTMGDAAASVGAP